MTGERSSRQQRRREIDRLRTEGRTSISRGLSSPTPEREFIAIALALAEPLERDGTGGAAHAAGLALRLASATIDQTASRDTPACTRGCDHCCHFAISASAPEVFHVARALKAGGSATGAMVARIAGRSRDIAGMSLDAVMAAYLPCPLLTDSACGVYAARPIVCRQFMSRSASACGAARAGESIEIPILHGAINAGVLSRNLLIAAADALGRDRRCYELTSALHIALSKPDAEKRWLAGSDVLGRALHVARPPDADAMVERLSATMKDILGTAR